jgi:hypothetical protein
MGTTKFPVDLQLQVSKFQDFAVGVTGSFLALLFYPFVFRIFAPFCHYAALRTT